MVLQKDEKLHIIERRYFADDIRRHFVGHVVDCSDSAIRIKGHAWVFDHVCGTFVRRPEERERIVFLGDRLTIIVLPADANLSDVVYETSPEKGLQVTDHRTFSLEVTEFSVMR